MDSIHPVLWTPAIFYDDADFQSITPPFKFFFSKISGDYINQPIWGQRCKSFNVRNLRAAVIS
jgi:hypothetical protein